MKPQGIQLAWITVSNIKDAVKFYTEIIGLSLLELNEQYGWAELSGPDGARLGIAQFDPAFSFKPGSNAIPTITVDDIQLACNELRSKKVRLIGEIQEVPGEVKLQTFSDSDGNTFQLCQVLK